jgi:hypothetical protein
MTNIKSVVEEINAPATCWEELWLGQFVFTYRGGRRQRKIAESQVYNQTLKHLQIPRFVFIKYKILQEIER